MKDKKIFEEFKTSFEKQNKILKIFLIILSVFQCFVLYFSIVSDTKFLAIKSDYFSKELPLKDICYLSIQTIADRKLDPRIVGPVIINYFKNNKKNTLSPLKIYEPTIIDSKRCMIVIREKDGLRSFTLNYEKTTKNYGYKILDINEDVSVEQEAI